MAESFGSAPRKIWNTLSSIKTGVLLLIIVVVVSAAGTIILQRPATDPDEMQRAYSPQVLHVLDSVGLTDVFHAWWFVLLLVLVSLSIVAASIQRFPNSWRYFSRPHRSADESFLKALQNQVQIPIRDEEAGLSAVEEVLRKAGLKPQRIVREKSFSIYAERSRISELAVYVVHASLLLIFLGGIVDALYGWRGFVSLTPGEQSAQVQLRDGVTRTLPFAIRCNGAGQEDYADGTPKKWWSKLAVVQDGNVISQKEIVVNDPLVYRGVRFYQSSYGPTGKLDKIVFKATPANANGIPQDISLGPGQAVRLDPDTTVRLAEFIPDYVVRDGNVYTRSMQVENPAAHLIVESKKAGTAVNYWLPPIDGFEQNSSSAYKFEARDLQMQHFTGLQVSHEPGQWWVWAGVILMGCGLACVFYIVHVRYWAVPAHDARGRLVLWIGGMANKNRDAFAQHFLKIVKQIESRAQATPEHRVEAHAVSMTGAKGRFA